MTKEAAIQAFFSRFGLPAMTSAAVGNDQTFPYLTYDLATGAWGDGETAIGVNLWFYTESEKIPNEKARELSAAIGMGGVLLPCDGGAIWLKRGVPFCQSLHEESDPNIKRRYINVSAEFFTSD